jgi:hypothetical protein
MGVDFVTIEAGKSEDKRKFNVHKDLIFAASPSFKATFNGGWKETSARSMPRTDMNPKVFAAFLDWLYFRRVPSIKFLCRQPCLSCGGSCKRPVPDCQALDFGTVPTEDEARVDAILEQDSSGTALYIFADQYNVPSLRERFINEIWGSKAHGGDEPHISGLVIAMENLPANSPLCRLLIDAFARTFDATSIICELDKFMCQRIVANV